MLVRSQLPFVLAMVAWALQLTTEYILSLRRGSAARD